MLSSSARRQARRSGEPQTSTKPTRWFVLRVPSNLENRMRDKLVQRLKTANLEGIVPNVLVPTETVSEVKGGRKRNYRRKIYPGYLLVQMDLTDDVWFLIRETSGIGVP